MLFEEQLARVSSVGHSMLAWDVLSENSICPQPATWTITDRLNVDPEHGANISNVASWRSSFFATMLWLLNAKSTGVIDFSYCPLIPAAQCSTYEDSNV
jgi:hypothetical protein